jgi:hydrogenase nickel incorporation protein HypB
MFRNASVLLINKIDLLQHVNCNLAELKSNALHINPKLQVFETSCTTEQGIDEWCVWLEKQVISKK